jgi:hypothetical protein
MNNMPTDEDMTARFLRQAKAERTTALKLRRETIAVAAMQGLLSGDLLDYNRSTRSEIAEDAYALADAMIAEGNK